MSSYLTQELVELSAELRALVKEITLLIKEERERRKTT